MDELSTANKKRARREIFIDKMISIDLNATQAMGSSAPPRLAKARWNTAGGRINPFFDDLTIEARTLLLFDRVDSYDINFSAPPLLRGGGPLGRGGGGAQRQLHNLKPIAFVVGNPSFRMFWHVEQPTRN